MYICVYMYLKSIIIQYSNYSVVSIPLYSSSFNCNWCTCQFNTTVETVITDSRTKVITDYIILPYMYTVYILYIYCIYTVYTCIHMYIVYMTTCTCESVTFSAMNCESLNNIHN